MNKSQKQISAIFIPIVVLVLTFGIASVALDSKEVCKGLISKSSINSSLKGRCLGEYESGDVNAFDFNKTWGIWLTALIVIGISEFKLLEDKKKADK